MRTCQDAQGKRPFDYAEVAARRISCAGFSGGDAPSMLAYWRAMEEGVHECRANDQGIHQQLLYVAPPRAFAFRLLPMRTSRALVTLGCVVEEMGTIEVPEQVSRVWQAARQGRRAPAFFGSDPHAVVACNRKRTTMCYDERGDFRNAAGEKPAAVHQYNRLPEMAERVLARYNRTAACARTRV
jgi:hypothetical protein